MRETDRRAAMGRSRMALILFVLCFPLAADAEEPLCAALARVRAAAPSAFAEIRGASKGDNRWDAKLLLPEFEECNLSRLDDGSLVYSCTATFEAKIEKSKQHLADFTGKVEACLGSANKIEAAQMTSFTAEDGTSVFLNNLPSMKATGDLDMETGWTVGLSVFPRPEPETAESAAQEASAAVERSPEPGPQREPATEAGKPKNLPNAEEFCPRFTRVLTAASDQFTAIRGKGNAEEGWDTTVKIPGLSHCTIENASLVYYNCSVSEQPDEASARAELDRWRSLLAQCLDESWEIGELKPQIAGRWSLEFWKGDHEPSVELILRGPGTYIKSWRLGLDINGPAPG